jgi:aspartyl-tRNA(Asn)/glutamyl-tRNA(Gln) amidotransferase subunit A
VICWQLSAPTTWGAEPFKERTIDFDATVIRKLRDAGAVLIAKLAMVELAGSFGYEAAGTPRSLARAKPLGG